jgi:hypothetical protein
MDPFSKHQSIHSSIKEKNTISVNETLSSSPSSSSLQATPLSPTHNRNLTLEMNNDTPQFLGSSLTNEQVDKDFISTTENFVRLPKTRKRKPNTMTEFSSSEEALIQQLQNIRVECQTSIDKVLELCSEPAIQKILEELRRRLTSGDLGTDLIQQLHLQQQHHAQRPWRPQITRLLLLLGCLVRHEKLMVRSLSLSLCLLHE